MKDEAPSQLYDGFCHNKVSAILQNFIIPFNEVNSSRYWNASENGDSSLLFIDLKLTI